MRLAVQWQRFQAFIVENRRVRWILIVVNMLGALYGFSWYFDQLASTELRFWPVVPDSPTSALMFGGVLLLYTLGLRARPLEAVAYMMTIKYGLWAATVLSAYALLYGEPTFETTHLTISHIGMALEAVIFLQYFHPGFYAGLFGAAWMIINDYFDYTYMTHPALPHSALLPAAQWIAIGLTVLILVVYYWKGSQVEPENNN